MDSEELRCPVCDEAFVSGDYPSLAAHFASLAAASDDNHVMWLNRRVTRERTDPATLADLLHVVLSTGSPPASMQRVER